MPKAKSKPPKLTKNDTEAKFQGDFVKWLRKKGCTCFKMTPGMGIPSGTPDYVCLFEGFWFMVEFKKSAKAKFRPGQEMFLKKFNEMSWAKVVYPENEAEIKAELEEMLK